MSKGGPVQIGGSCPVCNAPPNASALRRVTAIDRIADVIVCEGIGALKTDLRRHDWIDCAVRLPSQQESRFYEMLNDASCHVMEHTLGRIKRVVLTEEGGRLMGLVPRIGLNAATVMTAVGTIEISIEAKKS